MDCNGLKTNILILSPLPYLMTWRAITNWKEALPFVYSHAKQGGRDVETEDAWAHHEKAGFSGKDHHSGKGGRQQEKRKAKYEMDWFSKGSHRLEFAEQDGWGQDILEITHSWGCQKSRATRWWHITRKQGASGIVSLTWKRALEGETEPQNNRSSFSDYGSNPMLEEQQISGKYRIFPSGHMFLSTLCG